MDALRSDLVAILRDFLIAHQMLQRLFESFRQGTLRFEDVQNLAGDSEQSVLFRLKERCHALFRSQLARSSDSVRREALFDLAVGSLFHEAMKVRENLYQQEVYGPRVRSLRGEAEHEAGEFFREFERILAAAADRLEEALRETAILLAQTRKQLRVLMADHRGNGLIARYLVERRDEVDAVFDVHLDELLGEIYGSAGEGYALAARSYLESAYYDEALKTLAIAGERDAASAAALEGLAHYARGMQDFLEGDYDASLGHFDRWLASERCASEAAHARLAHSAVSRVPQLIEPDADPGIGARAAALSQRLEALAGPRSGGQAAAGFPAPRK